MASCRRMVRYGSRAFLVFGKILSRGKTMVGGGYVVANKDEINVLTMSLLGMLYDIIKL